MTTSGKLDQYRKYVDEELIAAIYQCAGMLRGKKVLHINTTKEGGGVAEILEGLTPITDELDIKHERKIVELDTQSNKFTDRLVDLLQGNLPGKVDPEGQHRYIDILRQKLPNADECYADMYVVHDFQLVPLAQLYPWLQPAVWFCHVDTANPNPDAEHYIRQFLSPYEFCLFNGAASVFHGLPAERTRVIRLGIDPFRLKHLPMSEEEGHRLLAHCGIDVERPLLTQVARFGRWKNPWQTVDIYRIVKQQIPTVQLALVGAMEAADDLAAIDVLKDVRAYAGDDPDVHLLHDPTLITDDEVNAFQRYSSVVLQRSTREGFGLTVTEAMWKSQPIVGTTATGLHTQIIDGVNGFLVDDTQASAECTLRLLQDRDLWAKMGQSAHEHVRKNFLLPMMLLDYLAVLTQLLGENEENVEHVS